MSESLADHARHSVAELAYLRSLAANAATTIGSTDECRACGASITLAEDGAWCDDSGACGCGVNEHYPGGFSQDAADQLARETPWYDNPREG